MVELECQRCGREWDYGGSRHYATCPNCKTSVKAGELAAEDPAERELVTNPMVGEEQTIPEALESLFNTAQALWEEQDRLAEQLEHAAGEESVEDVREDVDELGEALQEVVDYVGGDGDGDRADDAPVPGDIYDPTEEFDG